MTTDLIHAPWTTEQVAALNQFQQAGGMHPFTCGALHASGQSPVLDATHSGWICPDPACEYTQDWAHAFMADPSAWPRPFGDRHGPTPEEIRAVVSVPSPADRATLRDRIAGALSEARRPGLGGMTEADAVRYMADAVLAVLPEQTDRATLLREAAEAVENDSRSRRDRWGRYEREEYEAGMRAAAELLGRMADEAAVTPPPALTEEGRLRAQVAVLQQDAERDRGLAKVGARCMRDGHQGLIEGGRVVLEGWRFALSTALDLGTGAPWEAIHERVKELRRLAAEQPTETQDDTDLAEADVDRMLAEGVPVQIVTAPPATYGAQQRPAVGERPDTQTPCGPAPDVCDAEAGEPCVNHEREAAHAEGEHAFCGPECATP